MVKGRASGRGRERVEPIRGGAPVYNAPIDEFVPHIIKKYKGILK